MRTIWCTTTTSEVIFSDSVISVFSYISRFNLFLWWSCNTWLILHTCVDIPRLCHWVKLSSLREYAQFVKGFLWIFKCLTMTYVVLSGWPTYYEMFIVRFIWCMREWHRQKGRLPFTNSSRKPCFCFYILLSRLLDSHSHGFHCTPRVYWVYWTTREQWLAATAFMAFYFGQTQMHRYVRINDYQVFILRLPHPVSYRFTRLQCT